MQKRKYVPIIIDLFQRKNQLQHEVLTRNGMSPLWLQVNTTMCHTQDESRILLPSGFFRRTLNIVQLLLPIRKQIHHVEIYPGGRYMFFFLCIAKLLGLKIICAERGDLFYIHQGKYDKITKWSARQVYKFSDCIWIRELYAEKLLKEMGIDKPLHFIHNVVSLPDNTPQSFSSKDIDFLWVNTLKDFRRFDWLVQAMQDPFFSSCKTVVLGLTDVKKLHEIYGPNYEHVKNLPDNMELVPFSNPESYYQRARFFVLPTSLVYLNNALLEAMSHGVVPIICDCEGADQIVQHNVDGFITSYDFTSFKNQLQQLTELGEVEYGMLSIAAKEKVKKEFSPLYYERALLSMYKTLDV